MGRFEMSSDCHTLGLGFSMPAPIWLMFPAFLRAEKPAAGTAVDAEPSPSNEVSLENIEENQQFESALLKRVARVIENLPSLEPISE